MSGDKYIYALVALIIAVSAAFSGLRLWREMNAEEVAVEVQIDGVLDRRIEIVGTGIDPSPRTYELSGDFGYNSFSVDDGRVTMVSSDCGGHDCLRMPAVSSGGVIVCLPHRMILRVVGNRREKKGSLDDISY